MKIDGIRIRFDLHHLWIGACWDAQLGGWDRHSHLLRMVTIHLCFLPSIDLIIYLSWKKFLTPRDSWMVYPRNK